MCLLSTQYLLVIKNINRKSTTSKSIIPHTYKIQYQIGATTQLSLANTKTWPNFLPCLTIFLILYPLNKCGKVADVEQVVRVKESLPFCLFQVYQGNHCFNLPLQQK